ncbi:MAG: tRNA pseudouridine(38-40) synthase TruA [Alphaproteobacteria bacterium]
MARYKLIIEYDGNPYAGWQEQAGVTTVQARLRQAVQAFSGEDVTVFGAGRTDAGVHALGQVAHFDLGADWPADKVRDALNAHLRPELISVCSVALAAPDFDARFSATTRHYLYKILNRRAPAALDQGRVWQVPPRLDAQAMHAAAQTLVGHHDFTTFRSAHCQAKSPEKTLQSFSVVRDGEIIEFRLSARSFLHRQVRSMVGSLERVGRGKWPGAQIGAALGAKDRAACGPVAPAAGLYLVSVDYE